MKLGLKALAAASAALAVSITTAVTANDKVDADTLDFRKNSANTCILKNVGNHGDVYASSPIAVDSIRTCFLLGAANESKTITAMSKGRITGLFQYKSFDESYYDETPTYDEPPTQCEKTQVTFHPHGQNSTTLTGRTCE